LDDELEPAENRSEAPSGDENPSQVKEIARLENLLAQKLRS